MRPFRQLSATPPRLGASLIASALALGMVTGGRAQSVLPAPTILRPVFSSATPGHDAALPTGLLLILQKVPNVTAYQIVVEDLNGFVLFNQIKTLNQGMQDPQTVQYTIPIPAGKEGTTNRVRVRSCHPNGQCSTPSRQEQFIVLPSSPSLAAPAQGATVSTRTVTLSWGGRLRLPISASAGDYQVVVLTGAPEDVGFNGFRPDVVSPPSRSLRAKGSSSSLSVTLPTGQNAFIWSVARCLDYPVKGRRCGMVAAFRSLSVTSGPAVSFTASLAPTFQHPRCTNCHAVASSGLQTVVPAQQHQNVQVGNTANCAGCHDATLPNQGFNPGWHEAPASMDLRGKTPAQLCAMAQNPASAGTALNHLTQDRLILWAVGDGRVPNGQVRPLAPPGGIQAWQAAVQAWVNAGMPCP